MSKKRTFMSLLSRFGRNAKADARVRPGAPATETDEGKKTSLTPEQRRIADESLRRFDALYRKLADS